MQRAPALFVIGMGRSGTSALARVLSLCGAALPLRMLPANQANPTGYWEPLDAVVLNDVFLRTCATSWFDAGLTLPTVPPDEIVRRELITPAADLLRDGFDHDGPIVVKDPRITILLPYWLEAAAQACRPVKLIHVYRHPSEVAASLTTRDGLAAAHAAALWLKHNLLGERDGRPVTRTFASYEQLMHGWEPVVERCLGELGLELCIDDAARDAVAEFLSSDLRHHHASAADRSALEPPLSGWVDRVYSCVRAADAGALDPVELDAVFAEVADSRFSEHHAWAAPAAYVEAPNQ